MSSAIQRYPGLDKILEKHTDQVGGRYLNQKKRHFIKKKSSLSPHSQYWRKKYHKYRHKVKMLEGGSRASVDVAQARAQAIDQKAQETAENTVLKQAEVAETEVDKAIQKLRSVLAGKLKELLQEGSQFRKGISQNKDLETLIPYLKALEALIGSSTILSPDEKRHAVSLLLVGKPTAERFTEKQELITATANITLELNRLNQHKPTSGTWAGNLQTFLARGLIQDLKKVKIETSTVATVAQATQPTQAIKIESVEKPLETTLTVLRKLCQSIYDAYSREESIRGAIEAKTIFYKIRAVKLCQQSCQGQKVVRSKGIIPFFNSEKTYEEMYASLEKRYQAMNKKLKKFKDIATNLNITSTSYNSNTVTDTNKDIVELGEQLNKFMKEEVIIDKKPVPISDVVKQAESNLSNLIKTLRDVKIGTKIMPTQFGRESTKETEKRKTAMQIAQAKGGAAGAVGAAGATGADEDGKELSSNIEQEGENIFFQSFQLEDSLKDILKSSIFRYHPYFVQLPKNLETIRQLMEGLPATAKRVVTRNQQTFNQIKKYQVEIKELLGKITAHEDKIRVEVEGFLSGLELQENEIPAKLFEAKDGVIKTKVVETVEKLSTTGKMAQENDEKALLGYFQKLQCYSCSEFNIKQLTFMDIFENEIQGECRGGNCTQAQSDDCKKYKVNLQTRAIAAQLCGLEGPKNKVRLGDTKGYCEIAGHCLLAANIANYLVDNTREPLKERICAVVIRQKAIEMGCALLEKYLMEHKIESIHKYRLTEGDTSQHINQANALQNKRAGQTTKEQQAAERQQQALVTAKQRGQAQEQANQEALQAAEQAKQNINKSGGLFGANKTTRINDQLDYFNTNHAGKVDSYGQYMTGISKMGVNNHDKVLNKEDWAKERNTALSKQGLTAHKNEDISKLQVGQSFTVPDGTTGTIQHIVPDSGGPLNQGAGTVHLDTSATT